MFYDYEPRPYIGVTGFTEPEQVKAALETIPGNVFRNLMVGVLVNWQSLREEATMPLTHKRFPNPEDVKNIFQSHEKALNLVHYNTNKEFTSEILTNDIPTISWDAEGLLRDNENELIIDETTDYIKRSYSLPNSLIR